MNENIKCKECIKCEYCDIYGKVNCEYFYKEGDSNEK